eukprot:11812062-Karenia_brevis.AAC.1
MQDLGLEQELSVAILPDPCSHEKRLLVSILPDRRFCQCSIGRAVFARVAKSLFLFSLFPAAHILAILLCLLNGDLFQKDILQQFWSRQCALLKK